MEELKRLFSSYVFIFSERLGVKVGSILLLVLNEVN